MSGGKSQSVEKMRSEKAEVEDQRRIARDERAKLQRDINVIQRQAESSWATERMENALLRERINDIAAEIARLTVALEGADSPIEAMLASEPATTHGLRATNGEHKPAETGGEGKGNLAERSPAPPVDAPGNPRTHRTRPPAPPALHGP